MRKGLLAAVVIAMGTILLSTTSCYSTKDWLCQCTITTKWGDTWTSYEIITNQSEKDATALCDVRGEQMTQWWDPEDAPSVSCTIREIE